MHYLRKCGGGDIVMVSSIAGFKEGEGLVPYTASKHGVVGIMRGIHLTGTRENIRVNVVCPWMTSMIPILFACLSSVRSELTWIKKHAWFSRLNRGGTSGVYLRMKPRMWRGPFYFVPLRTGARMEIPIVGLVSPLRGRLFLWQVEKATKLKIGFKTWSQNGLGRKIARCFSRARNTLLDIVGTQRKCLGKNCRYCRL